MPTITGSELETWKQQYDWRNAFYEAFHGTYGSFDAPNHPIDRVTEVLASAEGENDGANWICVVKMDDGQFAMVSAGCDYTGWDCQASGVVEHYATPELACGVMALDPDMRQRLAPQLRALEAEGYVTLDWAAAPSVD